MNATLRVTLDSELVEALRQAAEQQGTSLEAVIEELARQYLRDARRQKIRAEFEHFRAQHAELKEKFLGQHVAIHDGRVVAYDADPLALVRRVRKRFGRVPILFTQVEDEPAQEYTLHSNNLAPSA
jgi:hypothetical protein